MCTSNVPVEPPARKCSSMAVSALRASVTFIAQTAGKLCKITLLYESAGDYPAFASSVVVAGGATFIVNADAKAWAAMRFSSCSDGEAEVGVENTCSKGEKLLIRMPCVSIVPPRQRRGGCR